MRQIGMIDVGNPFIQKPGQHPHDPAFGLPLFAQKQHVVTGQQRQVDFRDHGIVVTDNAGEQFFAGGQHAGEVITQLLLDRLGVPTPLLKFLERGRFRCCQDYVHSLSLL